MRYILLLLLLTPMLATQSGVLAQRGQRAITISSDAKQTFKGFGWNHNGFRFDKMDDPAERDRLLDMLFEDTKTNTLKLWWRMTNSGERHQDQFIRDYINSGFIDLARERGVEKFVLVPSSIRHSPERIVQEYALYKKFLRVLKDDYNFVPEYIELQNEADSWTGDNYVLATNEMDKLLRDLNMDTKILIGGHSKPDAKWIAATSAVKKDPATWAKAAGVSMHTYGMGSGSISFQYNPNLDYLWQDFQEDGKESWQTESGCGTNWATGPARMLSDFNHNVETWLHYIGVLPYHGGNPNEVGENAWRWIIAQQDGIKRVNNHYHYFRHAVQAFDYGAVFREARVTRSNTGSKTTTSPWSFGRQPDISMACALNPDGTWGFAMVNNTGSASTPPLLTYADAESFDVELEIEELAGTGNVVFELVRTRRGSDRSGPLTENGKFIQQVTATNGRITIPDFRGEDLITLRSVKKRATRTVTVSSEAKQTFKGFGWNHNGFRFDKMEDPAERDQLLNMLFEDTKTNTLKLWWRMTSVNSDERHQDKFIADYVTSGFIDLARKRGVEKFVLVPSSIRHSPERILDEYAVYKRFLRELKDEYGFVPEYIELQNEADSWTGNDYVLATNEMDKLLRDLNMDTKILIGGHSKPDAKWIAATSAVKKDPATWAKAAGVSMHTYGMGSGSISFQYNPNLDYLWQDFQEDGKESWQTESGCGTNWATGPARMLSDFNHNVETWLHYIGVLPYHGGNPNEVGENAWRWIIAQQDGIKRVNNHYYYFRHAVQAFDYGAVFREARVTRSNTGSKTTTSPWSFGRQPDISMACALNPDGTWGFAMVNNTGSASTPPLLTYADAESFDVELEIEELAGTGNVVFELVRTRRGSDRSGPLNENGEFIRKVTAVNGRVTIPDFRAEDLITIRSVEKLPIAAGSYRIINRLNGKPLRHAREPYARNQNERYAIVFPTNEEAGIEEWIVTPLDDGSYTIKSAARNQYLHQAQQVYRRNAGANYAIVVNDNKGSTKHWRIRPEGDGFYGIINKQSKKTLRSAQEVYSRNAAGNYAVVYTDIPNKSPAQWRFEPITSRLTTSQDSDVATDKQILLYPNPARDELSLINLDNARVTTVIIRDVAGRSVLNRTLSDVNVPINLRGLANGAHFVSIVQDGVQVATRKLVINR